jgi:hypothetical protein
MAASFIATRTTEEHYTAVNTIPIYPKTPKVAWGKLVLQIQLKMEPVLFPQFLQQERMAQE